jgi:hypothetical protein
MSRTYQQASSPVLIGAMTGTKAANVYSITKCQQAIRDLTGAMRDVTGNMPPLPGVFPELFRADRPYRERRRPRTRHGALGYVVAAVRPQGPKLRSRRLTWRKVTVKVRTRQERSRARRDRGRSASASRRDINLSAHQAQAPTRGNTTQSQGCRRSTRYPNDDLPT